MSGSESQHELVTDVVTLRVETTETGWALSSETWSALSALPWLHLQADRRGLRGVLRRGGDSDPIEALGGLTRDLAELGTVEVRDDVILVRPEASNFSDLNERLSKAGIEPVGLLIADGHPAAVLESWRADAIRSAF
jgi:hypothetical protein